MLVRCTRCPTTNSAIRSRRCQRLSTACCMEHSSQRPGPSPMLLWSCQSRYSLERFCIIPRPHSNDPLHFARTVPSIAQTHSGMLGSQEVPRRRRTAADCRCILRESRYPVRRRTEIDFDRWTRNHIAAIRRDCSPMLCLGCYSYRSQAWRTARLATAIGHRMRLSKLEGGWRLEGATVSKDSSPSSEGGSYLFRSITGRCEGREKVATSVRGIERAPTVRHKASCHFLRPCTTALNSVCPAYLPVVSLTGEYIPGTWTCCATFWEVLALASTWRECFTLLRHIFCRRGYIVDSFSRRVIHGKFG